MRIDGSMDAFTIPTVPLHKGENLPLTMPKEQSNIGETGIKKLEDRRQMTEEELFKQVKDANKELKSFDRRLEFSVHDTTHRIMVKVINTNDDSVIREIPSEKVLDMIAYVWKATGILVDEKR